MSHQQSHSVSVLETAADLSFNNLITVKNSNLYGYTDTKESLSFKISQAVVHQLYWTTADSKKTVLSRVIFVQGLQ